MHPIEIYYFLDINRLKTAICVRDYDFRFCHSKLKIMENANQRTKQKALCWLEKSGLTTYSVKRVVINGVYSTVQAGK